MNSLDYEEKYVLFLDILGFGAEVTKADSDLETRSRVRQLLQLIKDTLCNNPRTGLIFTYFSDCIVVSSNRSEDGLKEMIASIRWLSFNLLNRGYLVRGGLAVGLVQHDSEFVFGLPLLEAHKLECSVAVYPRTIISESVLEDVKLYGDVYLSEFLMDFDGKYFLNYLIDYRDYSKDTVWAGKMILDRSANLIINHTHKKLNEYTGRPLENVVWFQDFWNKEVATRGVFARIEKGVVDVLPDASPTQVVRRLAG